MGQRQPGECRNHGVSLAAIERAFRGSLAVFPDPAHSAAEERFKAIGRTEGGRGILIVFTLRTHENETFIRPISARFMHRKELDCYSAGTEKRQGR